jgi:hypothetical protein
VAAAATPAVEAAVLPFTGGGDLYLVTALGLLLIAAGTIALKLRTS